VKAKNKLVKSKIRRLNFTSLFSFHLMIINIIFVHTLLYVMVLQVGKICVLYLPQKHNAKSTQNSAKNVQISIIEKFPI